MDAYEESERKIWEKALEDSPHGHQWHTSFHASQFPGTPDTACARKSLYGLMNIPPSAPFSPYARGIMDAGKNQENEFVQRLEDAGLLISSPPNYNIQTGFKDPISWLTGNLDAVVRTGNRGHVIEFKGKDHNVIDDMLKGAKSYDTGHHLQLQVYLHFASLYYHDIYVTWVRRIHQGADKDYKLFVKDVLDRGLTDPITTGSIVYFSRQRPLHMCEFTVDYDPKLVQAGIDLLKQWKQDFIDGVLPPRDPSWMWMQQPCGYCDFKKLCKQDMKDGIDRLENSGAVAYAKSVRPSYDYKKTHDAVIARWEKK